MAISGWLQCHLHTPEHQGTLFLFDSRMYRYVAYKHNTFQGLGGRGSSINKSIFWKFIKNYSSWEDIFGMLFLTGGWASGHEPPITGHMILSTRSNFFMAGTVREPKLATATNLESEWQRHLVFPVVLLWFATHWRHL